MAVKKLQKKKNFEVKNGMEKNNFERLEEIYMREEHFQDWRSDNLSSLKEDFLAEILARDSDDFEAYCKQQFKDRD